MEPIRLESSFDSQPKIRLVIADDHAVVRLGVSGMLAHEAGFFFVGEAEDGDSAISQAVKLHPDILLLDLQMPGSVRLNVVQAVGRESPRVKIILWSGTITSSGIIEALEAGARGIVDKISMAGDLARVVRTVHSGDYWFDGAQFSNPIEAHKVLTRRFETPRKQKYGLTERELAVVQCIGEGCANRDIAKQLIMSEETAKRHLSNIFDKLGVSTRLELALFAITRGLVVVEAT